MSLILDALRKADAERERGSVPSLHSQPVVLPSVGTLSAQQHMTRELAMIAVGLIVTANTLSKLGFAWAGGRAYFLRLAPGLVLMVTAFWATWWLLR